MRAPSLLAGPDAAHAEEFAKVFKNSSLRVTDGQASRRLDDELGKKFCSAVREALCNAFDVGADFSAQPRPDESVAKIMAPAFFALIAQHLSLAKYETALAPMVKYIVQGTVVVSVWVPRAVLYPREGSSEGTMMTNDFQTLAIKATLDDVKSASSDIYVSTVGPGDMVYIPPGALTSWQARERLANRDFFAAFQGLLTIFLSISTSSQSRFNITHKPKLRPPHISHQANATNSTG